VGCTQIVYDAFNRMVEQNVGSTHTQLVYDPQGANFAYMSGQTLQKYMLPFAGGVQAVFNSVGLQYLRHSDWLGSSRWALDVNGNLYSGRAYALDPGLFQPTSPLAVVSQRVLSTAGPLPGSCRAARLSIQEQAAEPGCHADRTLCHGIRLGAVAAHQGHGETASAA
jgi:hypothetical protein